ncbi:M16 family metallopeptidase [Robertkochia solimangrovi]|uniref:M16 family metallopeptidase n=1 Tax=Robertkochia solimangrovi TaxID=2213046 RepID=UPI0013A5858F|nr:insulinase family protein [Robertkochia solimangrovi]
MIILLCAGIISIQESRAQKLNIPDEVVAVELKNGFSYYLVPSEEPGKIFFKLVAKAGSLTETSDNWGYTHFLEHMAFKGSKNFPGDSCIYELDQMGLRIGGEYNAFVNDTKTQFELTIPEHNDEMLRKSLMLMKDWVRDLEFDSTALEIEKKVVIEEIKKRNNKGPLYLKGTYLESNNGLGTIDEINAVSRLKLIDHYRKHYDVEQMALVVVGDVQKEILHEFMKESFGKLPKAKQKDLRIYPDFTRESIIANDYEDEQKRGNTTLILAFKSPSNAIDSYQDFKNSLIDQMVCSILEYRLRNRKKALKDATVSMGQIIPGTDMYNFRLLGSTKLLFKDRLETFNEVIGQILQYGFLAEEKDYFSKLILERYERLATEKVNTGSVIHYFLSGDVPVTSSTKNHMAERVVSELKLQDLRKRLEDMLKLHYSVIFDKNTASFSPEFDKELIRSKLTIFDTSGNIPFKYVKPSETNRFKMNRVVDSVSLDGDFSREGRIINYRKIDSYLHEIDLDNGYKVLVNKNGKEKAFLKLRVNYGLNTVAEQDRALYENVQRFLSDGIGNYDSKELYKLQRNMNVHDNTDIGDFDYEYEATGPSSGVENVLKNFNLFITKPRRNAAEVIMADYNTFKGRSHAEDYDQEREIYRKRIAGSYLSKPEDSLVSIEAIQRILEHEEKISGITDGSVIYISGDLPEDIDALIARYIGGIPRRKAPVLQTEKHLNESFEPAVREFEGKQDLALIDFMFRYRPQRKLTMKDQLLMEGLAQYGRFKLFEILRRKYGLIYAMGTSAFSGNTPEPAGGVSIRYMIEPLNIPRSVEIMKKEVFEPMSLGMLKDSEMEAFKAMIGSPYLIYFYDEDRLSEPYLKWIQDYGHAWSYDEIQAMIENLTSEEIRQVMKKVIDPEDPFLIIRRPDKKENLN